MTETQIIQLEEYQTITFPENSFDEEFERLVWHNYGKFVDITAPSWRNEKKWELRAKGWVGYLPVTNEITLSLQPKVPIGNLFQMLEVAYRLDFEVLGGLYESETLKEFYERLAKILALKVLDRKKKGLYRQYIDKREELPYVRGRIQLQKVYRKPWLAKMPSEYQEHTADIEDNQLLAWTLFVIIRSGNCGPKSISTIRKAYRELQRFVLLHPYTPKDCIDRLYDRLNEDYKPLHAICRFFLENSGPTIHLGDHSMVPFLIDMAQLFEIFVAEWLVQHLPYPYHLKSQDKIKIGPNGEVRFIIDLVIVNSETNDVVFVLDTKYKVPDSVSNNDINQIVTYAEVRNCKTGILIYPSEIGSPINYPFGEIQVSTLSFKIDSELDKAGDEFLEALLSLQMKAHNHD